MTRKNKSGFVRNDAEGKPNFALIPNFALEQLAQHYANGADKFGKWNWAKADSKEDYDSFEESMLRHVMEYRKGVETEDHFAAAMWNLIGMEHVKRQLNKDQTK